MILRKICHSTKKKTPLSHKYTTAIHSFLPHAQNISIEMLFSLFFLLFLVFAVSFKWDAVIKFHGNSYTEMKPKERKCQKKKHYIMQRIYKVKAVSNCETLESNDLIQKNAHTHRIQCMWRIIKIDSHSNLN